MEILITAILGVIGGFLLHAIAMKVNFKQVVIEDKKRLYTSIVSQWLKMRSFIYDHRQNPNIHPDFDHMYIECINISSGIQLISEQSDLSERITLLSYEIYNTHWSNLDPDRFNDLIDMFFVRKALEIIKIMRSDIRDTSRLELVDLIHILRGLVHVRKS